MQVYVVINAVCQDKHGVMDVMHGSLRRLRVCLATFLILFLPGGYVQAGDDGLDGAKEKVYARVGGGVFFLDLPESSPFIETNSREEVVGFLDHYDASNRAGPQIRLAVGGERDAFGRKLFAEASGFITFHSSSHVNEYERTSELWDELEAEQHGLTVAELRNLTDGAREARRGEIFNDKTRRNALLSAINSREDLRFAGWIGAIDGTALPGTPNFAWGDPLRVTTKREVDFYGVDLIVGTFLGQAARGRTSLFLGPSYKRLTQEADVFAYESNRLPTVNYMTLHEDLNASYYGGVLGLRFDVPFKKRWRFLADGKLGLYHLNAEYEGRQRTFLSSSETGRDRRTTLNLSDSAIAATLGLRASLSVIVLERITLQLGTGLEYLSHAPNMRYARVGETFGNGVPHNPARIAYADAFGLFSTLSVGVEF